MKRSYSVLFFSILVLAILALSCGTSSTSHQLQSITLSPAAANLQNYSNGQVQFTATGNYNSAPLTVTPLPSAYWGVCYNNAPTTAITVTSEGVAQCAEGTVGTYTVWADAPPNADGAVCNVIDACGGGCYVAGTAQLTCPAAK